tara:strand:- start:2885 stop:4153 length:1269 start_codon:yes stop_codon:yes gene_type:complete
MLQTSNIKKDAQKIISSLKKKNFEAEIIIKKIIKSDDFRIEIQKELNSLQSQMNSLSKEIGIYFSKGNKEEAELLKKETSKLKLLIQRKNEEQKQITAQIKDLLIQVPNIPNETVPDGNTEEDNEIIKTFGKTQNKNHINLPHWEIAKKYDIINFEKGNIITGSGFPLYKNKGAKLQRALINFFLDFNIEQGYIEYLPPLLVNESSAFGTGNFPDKEGQMYHIEKDNLFLIPTAEVPLTNVFRDEIIDSKKLPLKLTAYTPCFRREAGSYGKNVRGLNRLHQFDKVEIVQLSHPDKSYYHLDEMVKHVSNILEKLELPFRLVKLCGGDLSFSSSLTFDFEVFSCAQKKWLEVSSVSNFESFQATRSNIKFRDGSNLDYCHTLNGSALALPRIMAAILENNQTENGISIPKALHNYTGFKQIS